MRRRAILILTAISLLWGSGWIFDPLLAEVAAPFAATALTLAVAACLLALLSAAARLLQGSSSAPAIPLRATLLLALLMLGAPTVLMLVAGRHGIGGWPMLLYALLPLLTAFAADAWSPPMILAAGAVLVLIDSTISFAPGKLAWALLALLAVAAQAWGLRYAARVFRASGWRPLAASVWLQLALAAMLAGLCSLLFDPAPRLPPLAQWTSLPLLALLYLALAGTALPYLLLYRLLGNSVLVPEQIAAGQWLQTLFAVAESAFFARAHPAWTIYAAAAVLLGCTWKVLQPEQDTTPVSIALRDTSR